MISETIVSYLIITSVVKNLYNLEVNPRDLDKFVNSALEILNRLDAKDCQRSRSLFLNFLIDKYMLKLLETSSISEE